MALEAGDIVFLVIRMVPENPQQWWPVAAYSNQADADAHLSTHLETFHRVVHVRVTS